MAGRTVWVCNTGQKIITRLVGQSQPITLDIGSICLVGQSGSATLGRGSLHSW